MAPARPGGGGGHPGLPLALFGLVLLLAATGAVAGQDDDPTVAILREPADGEPVRAGIPTAFTWLLLDGDGEPSFHHDAVFEVRHDGKTLLETTAETGHDYDGIDTYRVVFPGPGTYTARVAVMDGDGGVLVEETVEGRVLPGPNRSAAAFLESPDETVVGEEVAFRYGLGGPSEPVPGTDLRFRVLRAEDGFLEAELDTSAGDGLHEVTYRFDEPGTYEVRVAGGGSGDEAVGAAAGSERISVAAGASPPVEGPPTRPPLENRVTTGEGGDGYELHGTYDPYTSIGPHGRLRLGAVVVDPAGPAAVGDVDYAAVLEAPDGTQRLQVEDLHEDDGVLTVVVSPSQVGDHRLRVEAQRGSWSGAVTLDFSVHPPAGALGAGPQFTDLEAPREVRAGEAGSYVLEVTDAAGVPLPHSEVDLRVRDGDGVPVLVGKLHNHEDGRYPVDLALPQAGDFTLAASPETLQPAPTPYYYGPEPGTRPDFGIPVAETVDRAGDVAGSAADEGDGSLEVPVGPAAALAVLVSAAAAVRWR